MIRGTKTALCPYLWVQYNLKTKRDKRALTVILSVIRGAKTRCVHTYGYSIVLKTKMYFRALKEPAAPAKA